MRIALVITLMVLLPLPAAAHPGKTDYRGGHKCWRNCGEWELLRGEYHLHDKDGKPVRLDQKESAPDPERPKEVPTPEERFLQAEPSGPQTPLPAQSDDKMPTQGPLAGKDKIVTVYEESLLSIYSILLGLLAFLMLLLLIFVRKKREGG